MITQQILIGNIPSILWGNASSRLYLYVHGQEGNKEEASFLAEKICVRGLIIPGLFEPSVRTLRATIPENGSRAFR